MVVEDINLFLYGNQKLELFLVNKLSSTQNLKNQIFDDKRFFLTDTWSWNEEIITAA